jgi:hypothetical protein
VLIVFLKKKRALEKYSITSETLLWISTIISVLQFKIPRMQLAAEEPPEARALTILPDSTDGFSDPVFDGFPHSAILAYP